MTNPLKNDLKNQDWHTVLHVFLVRVDNVVADMNVEVHSLVHGIPVEEAKLIHASPVCREVEFVLRFGPGAVHLVPCRPLHLKKPQSHHPFNSLLDISASNLPYSHPSHSHEAKEKKRKTHLIYHFLKILRLFSVLLLLFCQHRDLFSNSIPHKIQRSVTENGECQKTFCFLFLSIFCTRHLFSSTSPLNPSLGGTRLIGASEWLLHFSLITSHA